MRRSLSRAFAAFVALPSALALGAEQPVWDAKSHVLASRREAAAMLVGYFEEMCRPKPFEPRAGADFKAHQRALREKLLACAGLWPLPERVPLDARYSPPLDHEWCTVRRVAYQLWPEVYSTGLLFMPKALAEARSAPAVLCPHGHWENGNAHPVVQTRCLVLARMGYVVFSSTQNHCEDPAIGVSNQTLMIWSNIRALDLLQSLPEVDKARLGVTGCSGGGLQTQMLVAADDRVKAATIVGMTCDYREIVFAGAAHCGCNHFPNIMRTTDEPELSALGLPAAVQYLTMNDWTQSFARNNYPTIRRLYELNGLPDRTDCYYEPVGHSYDKPMRERMYGWMEKWLRGKAPGGPVPEPETKSFPVQALLGLKADLRGDKGLSQISRLYAQKLRYAAPQIAGRQEWDAYRGKMRAALRDLLGEPLPSRGAARLVASEERDGVALERILCPSEADLLVPVRLFRPTASKGRLPVLILCYDPAESELSAQPPASRPSDPPGVSSPPSGIWNLESGIRLRPKAAPAGKEAAPLAADQDALVALARRGALVVRPDVRFVGELSLKGMAGLTQGLLTFKPCSPLGEGSPDGFEASWTRNALLWGRPIPGTAATDLCAVLDYLATRPDADLSSTSVIARGKPAIAALFAAALDDRIASLDLDLGGKCFETRSLPLVPFVLQHGDVLQWSALLATRRLSLAGVPREAGDPAWLNAVFRAAGNPSGLRLQH